MVSLAHSLETNVLKLKAEVDKSLYIEPGFLSHTFSFV